jgi:hypothetical protein
MESGEHEHLSQLPGGTLSENERRLAYPLQHESEVQASITGAVLVHDRSPHLRVSGSPSSCEVNGRLHAAQFTSQHFLQEHLNSGFSGIAV